MTKVSVIKQGMARKWERHVYGRWRVFGQVLVVMGIILILMLTVVWSQKLYPSILDAKAAFEAILNEHDSAMDTQFFLDFEHLIQEEGTDLQLIYLWHVQNPERVTLDGVKPSLEQRGPYAYTKKVFRYNIRWPHNSLNVTYNEWYFLEPVTSNDDCRLMYFRQGLGEYATHASVEIPKACMDPEQEVTILNPKFMAVKAKHTTYNILAKTARPFFAEIETAFIQHFPRSVKIELLPEAMELIWNYRRALHASTLISILLQHTTLDHFISARYYSQTEPLLNTAGLIASATSATFATGSILQAAASDLGIPDWSNATLSKAQASIILNASIPWSPLNMSHGAPIWVGTGRFLGYVPKSYLDDATLSTQYAFDLLVNESQQALFTNNTLRAQAFVRGFASYLYENWMPSLPVAQLTAKDWAGSIETPIDSCDAGAYPVSTTVPRTIISTNHYYTYGCDFSISQNTSGPHLNASAARLIADPTKRDLGNALGLYEDENLIDWWSAYEYCNASSYGAATDCSGMTEARAAFLRLPSLLEVASGQSISKNDTQGLICDVALHLFETFASSPLLAIYAKSWLEARNDNLLNLDIEDLDADLGYAQWSGGYVTQALWGVPSVLNIERKGYWKFFKAEYTEDFIEFHGQAMAIGYSDMNMTRSDGRLLLRLLASTSPEAEIFRGEVARLATEYRCDDTYEFNVRDERVVEGFNTNQDDSELAGSCEPFSPYCDCQEGGRYFHPQNAYANFSSLLDSDSNDIIKAAALLDFISYSSGEQCAAIQEEYSNCKYLETEPNSNVWVTRCEQWETTISDGTWGIYCDQTTILKVDTPYIHSYRTVTDHPYPRKRGNVLATWLQQWAWRRVLIEGRILCDDPTACSYKNGGLFTTHSAKRLLFEGFIDRWAMLVLNDQLMPYNLTARCVNRSTIAIDEYCQAIENVECSDDLGIEIIRNEYLATDQDVPAEARLRLSRVSDNPAVVSAWYSHEIILNISNLSSITLDYSGQIEKAGLLVVDSPVFAMYLGKTRKPDLSEDEAREYDDGTNTDAVIDFQRDKDCTHRVLGGKKRFCNCDVTLNTGKRELADIFRVGEWYGNSTLKAGENFHGPPLQVHSGILGSTQQTEPFGFEGYRWLNFSYKFREKGLQNEANASIHFIDPDLLLIHNMQRQGRGDLDIGMADGSSEFYYEWPTRREASPDNYTRKVWIRANRFETTATTFIQARRRAGSAIIDEHGEFTTVPYGFASLQFLADAPLYISLPLFYGNAEWGGKEYLQVNFDTAADRRKHSYYVDIEPVSGQVVRSARRFQYNYRVERNALYPDIVSSQERCPLPTAAFNSNGFGCFLFFPTYWVSEERVHDGHRARRLKHFYLDFPIHVFDTAIYGLIAGVSLIFLGAVPWALTNRREKAFKRRIWVD